LLGLASETAPTAPQCAFNVHPAGRDVGMSGRRPGLAVL